jgi:hypothetical protein
MGEALGGPEVGLNGAKPEAELELIARIGVGHGAPSSCELRPRKRSAAPVCSARIVRAFDRMIQIAISEAAFAAIAKTMPLGSVGYEYESNERGERLVWLDKPVSTGSERCAGRARATATSSCRWRKTTRTRKSLHDRRSSPTDRFVANGCDQRSDEYGEGYPKENFARNE